MLTITRLIILPLFFILPLASAQDKGLDSLYRFTLQELLDIKVSVASTDLETVVGTPAIVSRYNRTDLEKMGITTLREMFNFIPGVIIQDSLPGFASVQIRGVDETFNQKVLFLLDGVPYHQPSHSIVPMEGIPWESISHVEVIRGPGAVFYGSQASGGVFNVITRTDTGNNSVSLKIGTNELYEGSAYYNTELPNESSFAFAAEYRSEDGYTVRYEENFPGFGIVSDEVARYLERQSGILRYTKGEFSLQFQAFSDTTVGINDGFINETTLQPFITSTKGQLIHVENTWNTDNSRATIFADYNYYTFEFQIENLFAPGTHALATKDGDGKNDYRFRYGGNVSYKINQALGLALGAEQETRSTDSYRFYFLENQKTPLVTLLEKGKTDEFSAYIQFDYTYLDWRFLAGGRFTDNEVSGKKHTPRAAAVYKIDEHQSIKALYSTGFNSPNFSQTSLGPHREASSIIGNASLTAEVVKTIDLAYSYSKSNILFVANVYSLDAEDFIVRKFSDSLGTISFFNDGNFKRKGAEIDFQIASQRSKLFLNLAYQKEGNKIDLDDPAAFNTPRTTFSVGGSTDIGTVHSVGGSISYIGARHNLEAYSVVHINYTARVADLEIFAVIRNILNEDILNPDNTTQNSDLIAHGEEGVNLQIGLKIHF
mgnify:CR=1 FL=1